MSEENGEAVGPSAEGVTDEYIRECVNRAIFAMRHYGKDRFQAEMSALLDALIARGATEAQLDVFDGLVSDKLAKKKTGGPKGPNFNGLLYSTTW